MNSAARALAIRFLSVGTLFFRSADAATLEYPPHVSYPLVGVYAIETSGGNSPGGVADKEIQFGHKTNCIMSYIYMSWWGNISDPSPIFATWENRPEYRKVFTVPLLPSNFSNPYDPNYQPTDADRKQAILDGANNAFNAKWEAFAHHLHRYFPNEPVYIRLGWEYNVVGEMNGPPTQEDFADSAYQANWKSYFRKIVCIIKSANPLAQIVFCPGRDANDFTGKAALYYPGDDVVDLIGLDTFDFWRPVLTESDWDDPDNPFAMYSGRAGIEFWSSFAKSRKKRLCFPEWGLVSGEVAESSHGGDNPLYIRKMFEFITDRKNNVEFAIYTEHYHRGISMPKAMGAYNETFAKVYNYTADARKKLAKRRYIVNGGKIP